MYAFLDISQVTKGHTLLIPKKASPNIYETELLNDAVVQQILRYNIPLQAHYFCITNLNEIFVWKIANNQAILINELPHWEEI